MRHGFLHISNLLLERSKGGIHIRDKYGLTSLHHAVIYGHLELVRLLLLRGSRLDAVAREHSTVLHLACRYRRTAITDLLLSSIEHQPKYFFLVGKQDCRGFTCVHWSAVKGDHETLSLFPEAFDVRDHIRLSPCLWAALKGNRICAHYLINKGAQLEHPDFDNGKSSGSLIRR